MVQTSAADTSVARAPRRRRMSADLRSRLERDVAEIRTQLEQVATKDDIREVKDHVDRRADEILEAIGCRSEAKPSNG